MDTALTVSIVSTGVAVMAFAVSLLTYVRAEREKVLVEKRDFLRTSMYLAERMQVAVLHFVAAPTPTTLSTHVLPVVEEFRKLKPVSLHWKDRQFYVEFNRLIAATGDAGAAFDKGPDNVVTAFQSLLTACVSYASLARNELLG